MAKRYWLVKSEPSVFSFDDLKKAPKRRTCWDGVRNYQARNFLREMKKDDGVLFYHSNSSPQIIAGTTVVVREAYPDPTQFDPKHDHYDADSSPDEPRWSMVDLELDESFTHPVSLQTLRETPGLEGMLLLRKGSRLSVTPVTAEEWRIIFASGRGKR